MRILSFDYCMMILQFSSVTTKSLDKVLHFLKHIYTIFLILPGTYFVFILFADAFLSSNAFYPSMCVCYLAFILESLGEIIYKPWDLFCSLKSAILKCMAWRNRLPTFITLAAANCSSDVTQALHFPHSMLSALAISSIWNKHPLSSLHHQCTITTFNASPYPQGLL